jgi:hypothetical protein
VLRRIVLLCIAWCLAVCAFAQTDKPVGKFLKSETRIGEEIPYSLSFTYPRNWQVLFPDSTQSFAPFEYSRRVYFPTKSDSLYSKDSTVYYLSTFELDSIQTFRMQVLIKIGEDTTSIFSDFDSIKLIPTLTQMPDSLAFLENTLWKQVSTRFNYPYLISALFLLAFLALAFWIAFGKRIKKWFKLKQLKKRHLAFMARFGTYKEQAQGKFDVSTTEKLLFFWKKYVEELERKPFTKLTTREILRIIDDPGFDSILKIIDRAIYSGATSSNLTMPFERLEEYAVRKFKEAETEILNA